MLVFDRYKNNEQLGLSRVQADESVIGEEFINYVATIQTCRILRKAGKASVLDKMTYGELMEHLEESARRIKVQQFNPTKSPSSTDDPWVNVTKVKITIYSHRRHKSRKAQKT